jgi:circadian clock protein KaiC
MATYSQGKGTEMANPPIEPADRAGLGIEGLDQILGGGLPRHRLYLIEGTPGVGKTTIALQFLLEGRARGEQGLYVTLSETTEELDAVARSHAWSLEGIAIFELADVDKAGEEDYTLFHPSEVELNEATRGVLAVVERTRPRRVVFDSLSELRLLARDPLRYRRQILALKQYFVGRQCTVLLLDDGTATPADLQLASLAHGVIELEQLSPEYGAERRRLRVKKMRGMSFDGGYHDFKVTTGGVVVFPRLVASTHHPGFAPETLQSGVHELDLLLGGGLERGSSTLIIGPAGAGKTTIGMRYALSAVERGEKAAVFTFEEGLGTLYARAAGLGWDLRKHVESGHLHVEQIDPAQLSPGEFAHRVRAAAVRGASVVIIDSLNGFLNAMPEEHHLHLHLHELLVFLNQSGVASVVVMAQHGFVGTMQAPVDVSYLADGAVVLRYFESDGGLKSAISVLKKRSGPHERAIREFSLGGPAGIRVGPPLKDLHGVLTGVPVRLGGPPLAKPPNG